MVSVATATDDGSAFAAALDAALHTLRKSLITEHERLISNQDPCTACTVAKAAVDADTDVIKDKERRGDGDGDGSESVAELPPRPPKRLVPEPSHAAPHEESSAARKQAARRFSTSSGGSGNSSRRQGTASNHEPSLVPDIWEIRKTARATGCANTQGVNPEAAETKRTSTRSNGSSNKNKFATEAAHTRMRSTPGVLYKYTGAFDSFMSVIIVLNTIALAIRSDVHPNADAWNIVDTVFAVFFSAEVVFKLLVFGCRGYFCGPAWAGNALEISLLFLSWLEVALAAISLEMTGSSTSLLRILRLLRIVKTMRLLRLEIFCDLVMMVNGAMGSMRTLLYSMILICAPLFVVALVFRETLGSESAEISGTACFSTLPWAFFTLFRCIVAGDCSNENGQPIFVLVTRAYGSIYALTYCFIMMLMTFGLFNVIVAIYVDNTLEAARHNELHVQRSRLRDTQFFQQKASELVRLIWFLHESGSDEDPPDHSAPFTLEMTPQFFEMLTSKKEVQQILSDLDIADDDQLDMFENLDVDGGGTVSVLELVEALYKLRGGEARRADIVSVGLIVRRMQVALREIMSKLECDSSVLEVGHSRSRLGPDEAAASEDQSEPASRQQALTMQSLCL
eukprot:TRINITY_DN4819_c0_g1_i1.p1 TRINITY_DN4819_c0_g1~~TRINITY_DN4819_c0_g1_i1.p1  ORF type:complete len:724 (-),score=129.42 TRINITY_DN4819_c0_g1_i1:37-1908(-)